MLQNDTKNPQIKHSLSIKIAASCAGVCVIAGPTLAPIEERLEGTCTPMESSFKQPIENHWW